MGHPRVFNPPARRLPSLELERMGRRRRSPTRGRHVWLQQLWCKCEDLGEYQKRKGKRKKEGKRTSTQTTWRIISGPIGSGGCRKHWTHHENGLAWVLHLLGIPERKNSWWRARGRLNTSNSQRVMENLSSVRQLINIGLFGLISSESCVGGGHFSANRSGIRSTDPDHRSTRHLEVSS